MSALEAQESGPRAGGYDAMSPLSAILTQFDASDASGTDIPVPLAKEIGRAGMIYCEFWRQGDVAIYRAKGKGNRIEYEVIKVQILPAQELGGRSYPLRESFPSSSQFGEEGWTFTDNSHRNPLAAAMAKAQAE
jgi:hypothetical protein